MTVWKPGIQTICLPVFLLVMLFGCTYSSTTSKQLEFSISKDSLYNEIREIVDYRDISVEGITINENSKKYNRLTILITNPSELPETLDQRRVIYKAVARTCRQALKHPEAYSEFIVSVRIIRNTRRTFKDDSFKLEKIEFNTEELK